MKKTLRIQSFFKAAIATTLLMLITASNNVYAMERKPTFLEVPQSSQDTMQDTLELKPRFELSPRKERYNPTDSPRRVCIALPTTSLSKNNPFIQFSPYFHVPSAEPIDMLKQIALELGEKYVSINTFITIILPLCNPKLTKEITRLQRFHLDPICAGSISTISNTLHQKRNAMHLVESLCASLKDAQNKLLELFEEGIEPVEEFKTRLIEHNNTLEMLWADYAARSHPNRRGSFQDGPNQLERNHRRGGMQEDQRSSQVPNLPTIDARFLPKEKPTKPRNNF